MIPLMLPFVRTSSVFKSRWMALLWAAGICWAAVEFVGPASDADEAGNAETAQRTDITGAPVSDQDIEKLEATLKGL